MSKTRKILSVVLAAALVFALAIPAFAAGVSRPENATDAQNYTQEWYLEAYPLDEEDPTSESWKDFADYFGNGYYVVDVYLTTNYAIGAVEFEFETTGEIEIIDAVEYEYPYKHCDCSFDGNKILVLPLSSSVEAGEKCDDDAIVTVFVSGNGTMKIKNNPKTAENIGGTLIATRLEPANTATGDMYYGQKVISVGDAVTIGEAAEAPTLAVIDGTAGVIDKTRNDLVEEGDAALTGYIYGLEPENYETVDAIFEVVGDGYMTIVANEQGSEAGTGTLVEVYDNSDALVETYALIIFGDIDGDGAITALDAGSAELHDFWNYGDDLRIADPLMLFAGDLDADCEVTAIDAGSMELHDFWNYGDALRFYQSEIIDLL